MKAIKTYSSGVLSLSCAAVLSASFSFASDVKMQEGLKSVPYDPSVFSSDPVYKDRPYNVAEQLKIYGDKKANEEIKKHFQPGEKGETTS